MGAEGAGEHELVCVCVCVYVEVCMYVGRWGTWSHAFSAPQRFLTFFFSSHGLEQLSFALRTKYVHKLRSRIKCIYTNTLSLYKKSTVCGRVQLQGIDCCFARVPSRNQTNTQIYIFFSLDSDGGSIGVLICTWQVLVWFVNGGVKCLFICTLII